MPKGRQPDIQDIGQSESMFTLSYHEEGGPFVRRPNVGSDVANVMASDMPIACRFVRIPNNSQHISALGRMLEMETSYLKK